MLRQQYSPNRVNDSPRGPPFRRDPFAEFSRGVGSTVDDVSAMRQYAARSGRLGNSMMPTKLSRAISPTEAPGVAGSILKGLIASGSQQSSVVSSVFRIFDLR